jgi:hypothetical protein
MSFQKGLHVRTATFGYWLDLRDHSTSTRDENSLAAMFHRVKELGEVPRGFGSTHFGH